MNAMIKRTLIFSILCFALVLCSRAQLVQAGLGPGSAPNRVKIYLRCATSMTGNIATLQFDLGIATGTSPLPTMAILKQYVPGAGTVGANGPGQWQITEADESGFHHYMITCGAAPLSPVFTANADFLAMEVEFNGGPSTNNDVSLVCLNGGGFGPTAGNALFFCYQLPSSDGSNLFYDYSGTGATTVVNQLSYDASQNPGCCDSKATIHNVKLNSSVLPVKWLSFTGMTDGGNALLRWSAVEDENTDRYELQRSSDGINFTSLATVPRQTFLSASASYLYTDVTAATAGHPWYYRIRQWDRDGRSALSRVISLAFGTKAGGLSVFPNPARDQVTLLMPGTASGDVVQAQLISSVGEVVVQQTFTGDPAGRYTLRIPKGTAAGLYRVIISVNGANAQAQSVMIEPE